MLENWFTDFKNILAISLKQKLPGYEAHKKMAPVHRLNDIKYNPGIEGAKESAILVLLFPEGHIIKSVIIKRPDYKGIHGGQISFPGGKKEDFDKSLIETAIREANEETGVNPEIIDISGTLSPLFVPPGKHNVLPVIGTCNGTPDLSPDAREVSKIKIIDFIDIINGKALSEIDIYNEGKYAFNAPAYKYEDFYIWGATAMIISELVEIFKRPELKTFFRHHI